MPDIYSGECSTAYATSAKTVSIADFVLSEGVLVAITFTAEVEGTLSSPTLNVSSTGAKAITYNATEIVFTPANNIVYLFQYNGESYVVVGYNSEKTETGGSYNDLADKPQIEGITLVGNRTLADLGLEGAKYFWHDSLGAHVTEVARDVWNQQHSGMNVLIDSNGMLIRQALVNLAKYLADRIQIGEDGKAHLTLDYRSLSIYDKEAATQNDDPFVWLADTRNSSGDAQLIESFVGDGSTTDYEMSWDVVSIISVTVNGTTTAAYTLSGNIISFNSAPADEAVIEVIYYSDTREAKAFTFGSRASGSVGLMSYAEGLDNIAGGYVSHAEGSVTEANGHYSHAEGVYTEANGVGTHAQGIGTIAGYDGQDVSGLFNDNDPDNIMEIGIGSDNTHRHNAFAVGLDGTVKAESIDNGGGYNDEGLLSSATISKWEAILTPTQSS